MNYLQKLNEMIKKHLFSILSLIISIIAISITLVNVSLSETDVTFNSLISTIGLIVTALSFLVAGYFVIIAVRAYEHVADIEKVKKQLDDAKCYFENISDTHANFFLGSIEHQILLESLLADQDSLESDKFKERENELYLTKARMSYIFPQLSLDQREKLFLDLGTLGNQEDIEQLNELLSQESNQRIIDIASQSIQKIRERIA